MVSRVALAAQYAIAAITRCRTKSARLGMIIMSGAHLAAAAVYLGITFRFSDSTNSRVFVAWYIIAFCETVVILAVSSKIKGINFERKDLPGRMKTATLLILGEGVIVVADNVATIVKNVNSWSKLPPPPPPSLNRAVSARRENSFSAATRSSQPPSLTHADLF